jgi:hypothetical protein
MNLLSCIEKVLIINYMTQLTIYFFLDNFLCVFDKCGLFTLAIFSNSVSGVLLEGRGWEVEGRKIIYRKSRVVYKKSGVVFLKYFMVFIVERRNLRAK